MSHEEYMRLALEEARLAAAEGEVPIGAIIEKDGVVIARAHNRVESEKQGIAHAEILAMQKASEIVGDWRLDGCTLYVTKEPCAMCAGAMVNCRISRLVFGCADTRLGAAGSTLAITNTPNALHSVNVISGVLEEECKTILQEFFRQRRIKGEYQCINTI